MLAGLALLPAAPALARSHGGRLASARRAGHLNVLITAWTQLPARPPLPLDAPPRDPFSEGLGRMIAGALGLRAQIDYVSFSGEALSWLTQGMADVAIAPVMTRLTARHVMFARPHLPIESVVLGPVEHRARRRLAQWAGESMAIIPSYQDVLEDLGQPVELLRTVPVSNIVELERAMLAGRARAGIATSLQARAILARHPDRPWAIRTALAIHPMAMAVAYGEHDLLRAVDQAIMLAIEQGDVAALFREVHRLPFPPLAAL